MKPGRALWLCLCGAALSGCARAPAVCAVPDVAPAPPVAQAERRLVASLANGADGGCRVRLRLPDSVAGEHWVTARDAALRDARVAAAVCCAGATASNAADWPPGASAFELAFACPAVH